MRKRVTIQEIAAKAGVNHSTASRALANHRHVAAATRARILKIATAMGYRPDPALTALARHRWEGKRRSESQVIAYIFWSGGLKTGEPHYLGARQAAGRLGYRLEGFSRQDYASDQALERVLWSRGITGLLFRFPRANYHLPSFDWKRFAAVNVGLLPNQGGMADAVNSDMFTLHREAILRVLETGCSRPGLVLHAPRYLAEENLRIGGLHAGMSAHGIDPQIPIFWMGEIERAREAEALMEWVGRHNLDVLLGQTESPFLVLKERGALKRISFVHLGMHSGKANYCGIVHDLERVGAVAVSLLAAKLEQRVFGIPENPVTVMVPGRWQSLPVCS